MSKITADQRKTLKYRQIFMRDSYKCVYCGRDMIGDIDDWLSLEIDHLKPKAEGGTDNPENLVTSCNVCNKMKSSYYPKGLITNDRPQNIALINQHIQDKREDERTRWLKALMQYDYYLNHDNEEVDDRDLEIARVLIK
mgnify:FL=1